MGIRDWAKRKNRELHRQALEDRDSKLWHSHAYHRYFEGYTEYNELDRNGKPHVRRVYTASWYTQDISRRRAVLLRVCYIALFLLMCGAVVVAGTRQGAAGTAFYIVLAELATLLLLAWLGYTLFVNYLFAPKKMTVHDYHASSGTVRRVSFALAVSFGMDILLTVLEAMLKGTDAFSNFGITLAAFTAGCVRAVIMHLTEKRVPYREIENKKEAPARGTVIEGETP